MIYAYITGLIIILILVFVSFNLKQKHQNKGFTVLFYLVLVVLVAYLLPSVSYLFL
ncbi:hypothetical protein OMQ_01008 [Enterococcus saccharolyticus subsp. saccharolyticus ATCC 43076]|uniref:Uncharacterized protein n=1 Tax=Enterococcus saccharolyticus subsp. saccharolyticus ATCC 43076 TaxID=1139996 RepID=S0JMD7_9ENTE|nr:hypothetical protein OMQ_01008 [Enterococcus saccharolyticus subsp. saccharolyticus ATCC 43076]EOT80855.1 hypothetical protein I572_01387 [Enterococcus saccharolyticus subsp. saccharolyticus ATCC 43076]